MNNILLFFLRVKAEIMFIVWQYENRQEEILKEKRRDFRLKIYMQERHRPQLRPRYKKRKEFERC